MTEEQKQALIEYVETSLNCLRHVTLKYAIDSEKKDINLNIKSLEVALSALTAQPDAWLVEFHEPMTDDYCREVKTVQLEKPTGHYMACATPLIRAAGYEVEGE